MKLRHKLWITLLVLFALLPTMLSARRCSPQLSHLGSEPGPTNISGQTFFYDKRSDSFVARGDARLTRGATLLTADMLEYDRSEHKDIAIGNVHLIEPMLEINASKASLDSNLETGVLNNAKISVRGRGFCPGGEIPEIRWPALARTRTDTLPVADVDRARRRGISGEVTWTVRWGARPLKGKVMSTSSISRDVLSLRQLPANADHMSGFLNPPSANPAGVASNTLQPYFRYQQNFDVTLALDVETSARIGGLAEYRIQNGRDDYLKVTGAFFDESIRSQQSRVGDVVDTQIADPHIPVDRYGIIGLTREHLTDDLVAYGDAVSVSDSLYLREMNIYTLSRGYGSNFGVLRTADSHFGLIDSFENSFLRLQGTWIQDLIQPQAMTLQTLPELLWSGRQQFADATGLF